jgi:hypothetical protein
MDLYIHCLVSLHCTLLNWLRTKQNSPSCFTFTFLFLLLIIIISFLFNVNISGDELQLKILFLSVTFLYFFIPFKVVNRANNSSVECLQKFGTDANTKANTSAESRCKGLTQSPCSISTSDRGQQRLYWL